MPVSWFVCPYKRDATALEPTRYCAMLDFDDTIQADGGAWSESEVLGGYAVVKVRASSATLTAIAQGTGFLRVPRDLRLSDPLSSLTPAQRSAIKTLLNDMGYSNAEIVGTLGSVNLDNVTLGQMLRFAAGRRLKPRYDAVQDQIVLDGAFQACRPIDDVDRDIADS